MSGVDNKRCMTCDRPVCYDEDRENIDDDLECLRTKPYCTNKGNATDWRTRCLAAEARIASFESLAVLATDFINEVRLARHQRDARGTGAMGAELPGNALSYVQPSALGELVRIARQLEIALPAPHKE